jgi:signal transduction histidine kinase
MRERSRRIDVAIAGGLLALGQLELIFRGTHGPAVAAHALWAAAAVAALWRRSHPLLFFAWALVVHAIVIAFDPGPDGAAIYALYTPLALFGLGAYVRDPRHAVMAAIGGVAAVMLLRVGLDVAGLLSDRSDDEWLREVGIFGPAAAGGVMLRDRTEALRDARRAAAAHIDGDEGAAVSLALTAERTRIARELHAVVRGCVHAVLDEIAAARSSVSARTGASRTAMRRARDASQQAMGEMRRMLSLLRSDPLEAGRRAALSPAAGEVGGVGRGRPDAADVPPTLDDLAARRPGGGPITVRRAHAGVPFTDAPLGAVAMRVLLAFASVPGCTRIVIERGDGVVRARARTTADLDHASLTALRERARLAGGRLRRGWLPHRGLVLTLPAEASATPPPVGRLPWLRLPAPLLAQGIPLLLLVLEVGEALLAHNASEISNGTAATPVRVAGAVAIAAAFLPRRRWPLLTVVLVLAIATLRTCVLGDWFGLNPPLYLAAFVAGAYARPMWAAALAGVVVACAPVVIVVATFGTEAYSLSVFVFVVTMVVAVWTAGVGGRRRLAEAAELRELTEEEDRRQAEETAAAVSAERLRVARELHDLVGHGLTAITLQCAAAEQLLDTRPPAAAAAIENVEEVCAEVLRELRQLLAALDGGEPELPQLGKLPELARRAESHGLRVRLDLVGDLGTVPPGHAGAAYRIVQEALTNARKHAGAVEVDVRVARERNRLTVDVRNGSGARRDGAASVPGSGSGLGLAGMRERVRVYDGRLAAGPEGDGGWAVRAELPVAPLPARAG